MNIKEFINNLRDEKEPKQNIGFFKSLKYSTIKINKLNELEVFEKTENKEKEEKLLKETKKYNRRLYLVMYLITLIICIVVANSYSSSIFKTIKEDKDIPKISYIDKEVKSDKKLAKEYSNGQLGILIDTNVNYIELYKETKLDDTKEYTEEEKEYFNNKMKILANTIKEVNLENVTYKTIVLVNKDGIRIYIPNINNEINELNLGTENIENVEIEGIINIAMASKIISIVVLFPVIILIFTLIGSWLLIRGFSIITLTILKGLNKTELKNYQIKQVAIYAGTLPLIIFAIGLTFSNLKSIIDGTIVDNFTNILIVLTTIFSIILSIIAEKNLNNLNTNNKKIIEDNKNEVEVEVKDEIKNTKEKVKKENGKTKKTVKNKKKK